MRKIVVSLIMLTVLTSSKTNAQVKDNLSLGPIAGFGHSWISAEKINVTGGNRKFKPSLNLGGRLVYNICLQWALNADLSYRTEGSKFENNSGNYKFQPDLHFIRFEPKLLFYFLHSNKTFKPKIGLGPSFGYLIGGTVTSYLGSFYGIRMSKSKDTYNNFDFGLSGSIGFNYKLKSKTWLNVDASYNHGFSSVNKDENITSADKNRSLFLNIGLTFDIGHAGRK